MIDLGANIGAFATYLHALNCDIDYKGHAIEPNPANHPLLERNLRGTRFSVHRLAIGPVEGQARFQTGGLPLDEAHLDEQGDLIVESSRLETLLARNEIPRVALLKIDIEGSEYDLIDRELTTLANRVDRILLEWHPVASRTCDDLRSSLAPHYETEVLSSREGRSGVLYATRR